MGNEENAGNQHFLFFSQYFLPYERQMKFLMFGVLLNLSSANASKLDKAQILSSDNGLSASYDNVVSMGDRDHAAKKILSEIYTDPHLAKYFGLNDLKIVMFLSYIST